MTACLPILINKDESCGLGGPNSKGMDQAKYLDNLNRNFYEKSQPVLLL
jgi:hypothetical protein